VQSGVGGHHAAKVMVEDGKDVMTDPRVRC
jgi:hypothetical protein